MNGRKDEADARDEKRIHGLHAKADRPRTEIGGKDEVRRPQGFGRHASEAAS